MPQSLVLLSYNLYLFFTINLFYGTVPFMSEVDVKNNYNLKINERVIPYLLSKIVLIFSFFFNLYHALLLSFEFFFITYLLSKKIEFKISI